MRGMQMRGRGAGLLGDFLSDATTRFRRNGSWERFRFGVRADHARDSAISPCFPLMVTEGHSAAREDSGPEGM